MVIDYVDDEYYSVCIVDWSHMFYLVCNLKKKREGGNLLRFVKGLRNLYNYVNDRPVFFERKGKLYYIFETNKIKEVDIKWEKYWEQLPLLQLLFRVLLEQAQLSLAQKEA